MGGRAAFKGLARARMQLLQILHVDTVEGGMKAGGELLRNVDYFMSGKYECVDMDNVISI